MDFKLLTLIGSQLVLEPFTENHRLALKTIAQDECLWTYSPTPAMGDKFDQWFDKAISEFQTGQQLPFAVRRLSDEKIIGTTRYYDKSDKHQHIAIGYTWYVPEVWGTKVNLECKYLLLKQAFEEWRMNRVAFFIDSRNLRSCAAVKKLGASLEGTLRQHMVLADGYIRDTVVFSIIQSEWPAIKAQLQSRLQI